MTNKDTKYFEAILSNKSVQLWDKYAEFGVRGDYHSFATSEQAQQAFVGLDQCEHYWQADRWLQHCLRAR